MEISTIVTVLSIIVMLWQAKKHYNLKKYIKAESMELYQVADNLRASVQSCLKALYSENTSVGIAEAGKVEGLANTLFTRSIKNIHLHFNYTRSDIDNWITNKKIHNEHKNDFLRYCDK